MRRNSRKKLKDPNDYPFFGMRISPVMKARILAVIKAAARSGRRMSKSQIGAECFQIGLPKLENMYGITK